MTSTADRVAQWLAAEQAARPLWSEDRRHACEVGHVVALDFEARAAYLATVLKKRGAEAHTRLACDVTDALNAGVRRQARRDADAMVSALGLAPVPGDLDPAADMPLDHAAF